jgi:hypothetical protein
VRSHRILRVSAAAVLRKPQKFPSFAFGVTAASTDLVDAILGLGWPARGTNIA